MSLQPIPVPLTSFVLHSMFLFFSDLLVFPLCYGCHCSGSRSVGISNLAGFQLAKWSQVTKVSFFSFPLFPIEKCFFCSLSEGGKAAGAEQRKGFTHTSAVQDVYFHVPNHCVCLAVGKQDSVPGGTADLGGFVAFAGSRCGSTAQILTELPTLHAAGGSCNSSVWCDAICPLRRCSRKQMSCAAEQAALRVL